MNKNIIKKLNILENVYINNYAKYKKFIIYYYFLELIVKKYFERIIIEKLLTADTLVDFFDRNEFGLKNNQIYKKDIIDETTFYGELKNSELEKTIKKDFELSLLEEIGKANIPIDIENYINVKVDIDMINNIRVYSIYLRFYRTHLIISHKNLFIRQLVIIFTVLLSIILLLFYYNIF